MKCERKRDTSAAKSRWREVILKRSITSLTFWVIFVGEGSQLKRVYSDETAPKHIATVQTAGLGFHTELTWFCLRLLAQQARP